MLYRHLIEEHREYPFLHFTSIFSAQDDHLFLCEVQSHRGCRCHPGGEAIGRESSSIVNRVIRAKFVQLLQSWAYEHVPHEQSMVSTGADDTNTDSAALVPSSIPIDDINSIPGVEIVYRTLPIDLPHLEQQQVMLAIGSNRHVNYIQIGLGRRSEEGLCGVAPLPAQNKPQTSPPSGQHRFCTCTCQLDGEERYVLTLPEESWAYLQAPTKPHAPSQVLVQCACLGGSDRFSHPKTRSRPPLM